MDFLKDQSTSSKLRGKTDSVSVGWNCTPRWAIISPVISRVVTTSLISGWNDPSSQLIMPFIGVITPLSPVIAGRGPTLQVFWHKKPVTFPETNSKPWQLMVGRQAVPLGAIWNYFHKTNIATWKWMIEKLLSFWSLWAYFQWRLLLVSGRVSCGFIFTRV